MILSEDEKILSEDEFYIFFYIRAKIFAIFAPPSGNFYQKGDAFSGG